MKTYLLKHFENKFLFILQISKLIKATIVYLKPTLKLESITQKNLIKTIQ